MGMDRPLSDGFVALVDGWVPRAVEPRSASRPSLCTVILAATIRFYPLLLSAALLVAVWMLATTRDRAVQAVSAGIVADLLTVPLYSSYVIPRYLLGAVLLGWCLLWLLSAGGWRQRRRHSDLHEAGRPERQPPHRRALPPARGINPGAP